MASDKPVRLNNVLPKGVQIKAEPGTSMSVPVNNIKVEPGLSTTTTRLTSFRVPRDLTLGGNIKTEKPKKVYVPNLNVQRNKNKDETGPVKNEQTKNQRGRDRGRGRGRGDRGRGKLAHNLIQSTGVFSEGISDKLPMTRRYGGIRESSDNARVTLEKPKLNLNHCIDKAEEEEKLKLLLRDDFIDDGIDQESDNAPVMLPLIEEGKLYKEQSKTESIVDNGTDDVDIKPTILENGEVAKVTKEMKVKPHVKHDEPKKLPDMVPQIIESKQNSYILMQFPDCLPGLQSSNDDIRPVQSLDKRSEKESENKTKPEYCTLGTLKGGLLGKLQILKSGKARLQLGDNRLLIDVGSNISFRQDLLAAKVDTVKLDGELINLGPVNSTLVCSPDWESMLAKL